MFDERIIRKLQRFRLETDRVRAGSFQGERRSKRRGHSNEFADYRAYVPGDDIRRIDWNIYARHERPFLRLYDDEQDLDVHVLLDASASMNWGQGEQNKFNYSLNLGGAIGVIALSGGDRFQISVLRDAEVDESSLGMRGHLSTQRLMSFLVAQSASGRTSLSASLSAFGKQHRRPGLLFVLSDLFSEDGFEEGLQKLDALGHEIVVIQILSQEEIAPQWSGELQFEDVETGITREVSLGPEAIAGYQKRLASWQTTLRRFCQKRGIRFLPARTDQSWEAFLIGDLRRLGVVR